MCSITFGVGAVVSQVSGGGERQICETKDSGILPVAGF